MIKRLRICTMLALAVLLSACASGQTNAIVQSERVVVPPVQPTLASEEKVVTLVPEGERTTPEQPAVPPTTVPPTVSAIDEQAQAAVTDALRSLLGAPALELALKGPDRSPNASNYPAVLYVDQFGNSYYVNPDTLQPIEFTLMMPVQDAQSGVKTPDELRAIAEELAKTHSTRFEAMKDKLTYTEGNKGENNFYRWEMPGTDVGRMPALLQIGLKEDGSLFSYLNSLDLLP